MKTLNWPFQLFSFFKYAFYSFLYIAQLQELTCAKATAGTHGPAWFRSGLANRGDADRAAQNSPALLRTHILQRIYRFISIIKGKQ